jgi:hypothetical protein
MAGFTIRERLVSQQFLDCSVGRPCTVTHAGRATTVVDYNYQNSTSGPFLVTGTIPPEIGGMKSLQYL